MADRIVTGDTPRLTNTFEVDGTPTDPTTITLVVVDPQGNTEGTYTYAGGTVTKSSTGVYYRDVTVDEDGVWEFTWTGTGTAADITAGSFTVWPVAVDDIDILTMDELKAAIPTGQANTSRDAELRLLITAVSQMLDENCGPIRTRTVTAEQHTGGCYDFTVNRWPISSVVAVTNYVAGSGAALSAVAYGSVGTGYRLNKRTSGTGNYTGQVCHTGVGFGDQVEISYVAGRYPSTEVIHPKFKEAAILVIRHLKNSTEISIRELGDYTLPFGSFPATFALPNSVRDLLGDDWQGEKNRVMAPVLFG